MDTLQLTTTGARTFVPATVPVMFIRTDDSVLVVASNFGATHEPNWYRNIVADPIVHVEEPGRGYDGAARVLASSYRDAAWQKLVAEHPLFLEEQEQARRELPVVEILETLD